MHEKKLSTVDEVAYKHSIWDDRDKKNQMFSQAVRVLAQKTQLMSLIATNTGELYYAGIGNLLSVEDFLNVQLSKRLFKRLDEVNFWEEILRLVHIADEDLFYILGQEDFRDPVFDTCSSIFADFEASQSRGIIGVLGPKYIQYESIVPQLRFFSHLLEDMIKKEAQPK